MRRTHQTCPACEGIDTTLIMPGLLACHDCGDEFAVPGKGPASPPSRPDPGAASSFGYHGRPQPC